MQPVKLESEHMSSVLVCRYGGYAFNHIFIIFSLPKICSVFSPSILLEMRRQGWMTKSMRDC